MSGSSWSLVVPVLLAGLGFGAALVLWMRRGSASGDAAGRDRDLELADLRARQEDLYRQLRHAGDAERAELELAAARNLKAIEEAGGDAEASRGAAPAAGAEPATAAPAPAARASSAWLGFLGGAACAALVGLLIVWAQRDASPREDGMTAESSGVAMPDGEHPGGARLSARDAEALEQLARQIDENPTDVMARKQYAVALLSTGQFVEAFEQAEILLASDEGDPDGLYVTAMVRMRMGQEAAASDYFRRLLADYPEHVPALTALGVLELRTSGLEAAEALWERALAASGGRNPEIESLMETARQQVAGMAPRASAPPAASAAAVASAAAPAADGYTVSIELADGAANPPSAVLFISLRKGDSGPPAAVRRIPRPSFPMTVTLSAADSMLGRPLPTDASVWARLDGDGSASTREEGEPFAEATMNIGESASLLLQ